jgi:hypothetical protein
MKTSILSTLVLLLALAGPAAAADRPERTQRPPCSGVYNGSARGIFWCRVVAVHDPKGNRSSLRLEVAEDVQLTGDALLVTPGGIEWSGPMAAGTVRTGEGPVLSAWSYVQTGLPPNPADYVAAKAWAKFPVEQGQVKLELTSVAPGPVADGVQTFLVHGTLSARLVPLPGSKAFGDVRVTITF